jgi:hypothetical protein
LELKSDFFNATNRPEMSLLMACNYHQQKSLFWQNLFILFSLKFEFSQAANKKNEM